MTALAIDELRQRLHPGSVLITRPSRWILLSAPRYENRSILIGNAAHATTAHMGMGERMALADSVVFAQCIRDAPTVDEAFKVYLDRCYERVKTVVTTSVSKNSPISNNATLHRLKVWGCLQPPSQHLAVPTKAAVPRKFRRAMAGPIYSSGEKRGVVKREVTRCRCLLGYLGGFAPEPLPFQHKERKRAGNWVQWRLRRNGRCCASC